MGNKIFFFIVTFIMYLNGQILYEFWSAIIGEPETIQTTLIIFLSCISVGFLITLITLWKIRKRLVWFEENPTSQNPEEKRWEDTFHIFISSVLCLIFGGVLLFGVNFGGRIISIFEEIHFSNYAENLIEQTLNKPRY